MNARFIHPCDQVPANPKIGDLWKLGATLYEYDGSIWVQYHEQSKTPEQQREDRVVDLLTDIAKKLDDIRGLLVAVRTNTQPRPKAEPGFFGKHASGGWFD